MTATPPLPDCGVVADIRRQPAVLRDVVDRNAEALRRAHELLRSAHAVRLAGLGSSRHAAGFGAVALDVLGHLPAVVLPAPGASVPLPSSSGDDVLVAVSQSGRTPALVELAQGVRSRGTSVVAVVNDVDSPLSDLADVVLDCAAGPEHAVAATASVTAQMLVLRAVAGSLPTAAVTELAAAVQTLLLSPRIVPGPPPAHVVAGGFAAEWVADEIALKYAEIAGRLPSADSLVDHLHGPVAAAGRTIAFVDDGDDNEAALVSAAHVTTVGPAARHDVVVPHLRDPSLAAILRVVVGQLFAVLAAVEVGADPDAARGLQKVTATR